MLLSMKLVIDLPTSKIHASEVYIANLKVWLVCFMHADKYCTAETVMYYQDIHIYTSH